MAQIDTFKTGPKLTVGASSFDIISLAALRKQHPRVAELLHSMKVLLENLGEGVDRPGKPGGDPPASATRAPCPNPSPTPSAD